VHRGGVTCGSIIQKKKKAQERKRSWQISWNVLSSYGKQKKSSSDISHDLKGGGGVKEWRGNWNGCSREKREQLAGARTPCQDRLGGAQSGAGEDKRITDNGGAK